MHYRVKAKILVVEHDLADIEFIEYELNKGGINFILEAVQTEADYLNALQNSPPDLILCDYSLPEYDGPAAFEMRQEIAPETPFIFVSGNIGEENSIDFIKKGVTDYVLKDKLFTLCTKVNRALSESKEKRQKGKTEQELIDSEARLKEAQALSHISNWEIDLITGTHNWSDEFYAIFETTRVDVTPSAETFLSFLHPQDVDRVQAIIAKTFKTFEGASFYARVNPEITGNKFIYSKWRIEFDRYKKPVRLYGILQDITERKNAEVEKEKITNDLLQRNKDLEQFAYIVSHNLRSPVANILGTSEAIRTMKLDESETEEMMYSLSASAMKLNGVILDLNQILQVKRNVSEKKEAVSFSHMVKNIIISIGDLVKKEQVEIKTDFSEVDKIESFKSYLYSVFYNLISNSIKYRQPDLTPLIEIKSFVLNNHIEIHFKDNGMGIDLSTKGDLVFGLYKRFHNHTEGKGMGLFMVKTQVETLGGKISIKSEVNKGTTFTIQLPA
jgi:signal transduction histidine kinase/CheY-like chemotaxis protein